ncbi:SbmA/BacA-like family transporter [Campylobacter rectus]|nr:SbmA/BacA-like family transporter [Campylobacter rectus]
MYRFVDAAKNLGSQVADAAMTLIASIPILWALSGH